MIAFILLACSAGKSSESDTGAASASMTDSGASADTGAAPGADWLKATAVWGSEDEGYTTGGSLVDVDLDGDLDLIAANGNDMLPGHLVVYFNRGDGLPDVPQWYSEIPRYYGHIDTGDLNGDGWPDVVVSRFLGADGFESPGASKRGWAPRWGLEFQGVLTYFAMTLFHDMCSMTFVSLFFS